MDDGVKFAIENIEKALKIVNENEDFKFLKYKVIREYHYLKSIKHTGNLYNYFLKFRNNKHKYAKDFVLLEQYGFIPNEKMANYLKDNYFNELNNFSSLEELVIGNTYTNNEIASTFVCDNMSGIRRSYETNTLVLICKHNSSLYDDEWTDDGILNYTGMGKVGDQSINYSKNKVLLRSKELGLRVYLFESFKENEYYFCGEVELCGNVYMDRELDINGDIRDVVKFPIKRLDGKSGTVVSNKAMEEAQKSKEKEVKKLTQDELKKRIKNKKSKVLIRETKLYYRERDIYVKEFVKNRASGKCDLCNKEAPFMSKKNDPFLESHHVIHLANGGPDEIYNSVALCPNCHRKIHVLNLKSDFNKLQKKILYYLKRENDVLSLNKFYKLFDYKK